MTEVGIIGAGPAGLATARYLASEGFEPVLFEQGATIGGQWSGDRARSGVWPSMRAHQPDPDRVQRSAARKCCAGVSLEPDDSRISVRLRRRTRAALRRPALTHSHAFWRAGIRARDRGDGRLPALPRADQAITSCLRVITRWRRKRFPPIELQARWIAYTWSGAVPAPSDEEMTASVAACHARRGLPQKGRMNVVSVQFAKAARVEPSLERWPDLAMPLLFGPLSPASFRLEGRDALPDAPARVAADAETFGCVPSGAPTTAQCQQLEELAGVSGSDSLKTVLHTLRQVRAITE